MAPVSLAQTMVVTLLIGFKVNISYILADIPFSSSIYVAFKASATIIPLAIIVASLPFLSLTAFPVLMLYLLYIF